MNELNTPDDRLWQSMLLMCHGLHETYQIKQASYVMKLVEDALSNKNAPEQINKN